MARSFRRHVGRRIGDSIVRFVIRRGWSGEHERVLTVRGRSSGRPYSTPVRLVEHGGHPWLVAPYGEVAWVRNARAAGEVTLRRGRDEERVRVEEVAAEEAGPVLREYLRSVKLVGPYFDARPDDPPEAFAAEADRHPVFRLGR